MLQHPHAVITRRRAKGIAFTVFASTALTALPAAASTDINSGSTVQASNLSGSVNFNGGTLQIDKAATYSNAFTLKDATTSTIDAHGLAATLSGALSGTGGLSVVDTAGGGAITLTGDSYPSTTTASSSNYTGTFTINSGATLALADTKDSSGNVTKSPNITGASVVANGTFDISGTTAPTIVSLTGSGSVNLGAATLVLSNAAGTFSGVASGTGGLVMSAGSLTLTGVNTFTGAATVSTGTLALSGSGSLAQASAVVANGTFDISATSGTAIKSLSGGGVVNLGTQTLTLTAASGVFSGTINGTGGLVLVSGTQTVTGTTAFSGPVSIASGAQLYMGGSTIANAILNSGSFGFSSGGTIAMTGTISGAGAVSVAGGIITVSTPQTYTGSTTITTGTLALSGAGSIATSSDVIANGTLDISSGGAAAITSLGGNGIVSLGAQTLTITAANDSFSGAILGTGNLVIAGGNQTLSGASTLSGTTTISGGSLTLLPGGSLNTSAVIDNGTLDLSASSTTTVATSASIASLGGAGAVTLGGHTLVLVNAADTFSGIISGSGGVTIVSGNETFAGANTYTGPTTISAGTLALSATGSLAAASRVEADGTFDISAAAGPSLTLASLSGTGTVNLGANALTLTNGNGVFSGTIAGSGGLTVTGGAVVLSGANTYTGGTTISGGTLQIGNRGAGGSIVGDVSNAGTLGFARTDTFVFAGLISGSGAVVQSGAGTTILTGNNTYSGGTTITAGTLQIGGGGTSGSIIGNVTNNGTLAFGRSDASTFTAVISGSGGVTQVSGTTSLTAANTYTGFTTIKSGATLALQGSIAASAGVIDNGTFDISGAAAPQIKSLSGSGSVALGAQTLTLTAAGGTFSGSIAGAGGLTLTGGSQTLSGTNTYTGATAVNGGTLTVNGSIAASPGVTVNSGGTLSGTGTVSAVTVASGGTLAPGSASAGTLTVAGPVSFAGGSTFAVNVASGSATSLVTTGPASLNGNLSVVSADGSYLLGQKVTILSADGAITGSFTAPAIAHSGAEFAAHLDYSDPHKVQLEIDLAKLSPALAASASLNQKHAIGGIDAAITGGAALPQAFQNLGNATSDALASDASQFAGEVGADIPQVGSTLFNTFLDAVFDHVSDGKLSRGTHATDAWLTGFGGSASIDAPSDASGRHGFKSSTAGVVGGASFELTPAVTLGGAISAATADFHVSDGLGTGNATALQGGVYGFVRFSPHFYSSFAAGAGFTSAKTTRLLSVAGSDTLAGKVDATVYGGRYESGMVLAYLTPYVAVQEEFVSLPAYSETAKAGSASFALAYDSRSINIGRAELGVRNAFDLEFTPRWLLTPDGTLHLTDKLAWSHAFGGQSQTTAQFAELAGSSFSILHAAPGKDSALVSLGAELQFNGGVRLSAHLDGNLSPNAQSYAGMAGVGYTW